MTPSRCASKWSRTARYESDVARQALLATTSAGTLRELTPLVEIGVHHEQRHQELLLTDIKHVFSVNPLYPVYRSHTPAMAASVPALAWVGFDEGLYQIGYDGDGFSYDNEGPRHRFS